MDLVLHIKQTFLSISFPMGSQFALQYPPWSGCHSGGVRVFPVQFERTASADSIRQRTFNTSLAVSWERKKHTTPSVPQRVCQLWGGKHWVWICKEKQSFIVSNVCALFCGNTGRRVTRGGDAALRRRSRDALGLLRPRRAAGGRAASALSLKGCGGEVMNTPGPNVLNPTQGIGVPSCFHPSVGSAFS